MVVSLEAVYGGPLTTLELERGRVMKTGIRKARAAGPVAVGRRGIEGDESSYYSREEGDTALHLFPFEHYATLSRLAGREVASPCFGENLSTTGYLETEMRIDDLLRVGPVLLRVTQPVIRCARPGAISGVPKLLDWINEHTTIGCYLAVVEPGSIAPGDTVTLEARGDAAWTVARLHALWRAGDPGPETEEALALPGLSDKWKGRMRKRLG